MEKYFSDKELYKKLANAEEVFWTNPEHSSFACNVSEVSDTDICNIDVVQLRASTCNTTVNCPVNTTGTPDNKSSLNRVDVNVDELNKKIREASERLKRFAPLIMHYFPETRSTQGIIESPIQEISGMKKYFEGAKGRLLIKLDANLPVAGSVKARGGIHEVLKVTEDIALSQGLIFGVDDDYLKLTSDESRKVFSKYKMQVGSTGNLGLSIGIMSSAIGFEAIVHMSADAKQWKKELLRNKGATVIEYEGDYGQAVASGRAASDADAFSHFVDDESSVALFTGYAVAAERLKLQLESANIKVDSEHPLFVYIPCGVGGAPGGISYGLKNVYGDNVHCFFAEPTQAPCMLLGLASGLSNKISVNDISLTGKTAADGLAVGRCSALVAKYMKHMLSGESTVDDARLNEYMRKLWNTEGIFIEPSSCAAFHTYESLFQTQEGLNYITKCTETSLHHTFAFNPNACEPINHEPAENKLANCKGCIQNYCETINYMDNSTHIIWATGGSLMPEAERNSLLS